MNHSASAISFETPMVRALSDILIKAVLLALSILVFITLHELAHLVIGRLLSIPAVFTGLTSAGLPKDVNPLQYGPAQLALMNGIAPLFTVVVGFLVLLFLTRRPTALAKSLRYFLAWWAIMGIPYLGVQLMIVVTHVDYSGNGSDSAAVAGYLHLPIVLRAGLHVLGYLYLIISACWLARTFLATTPKMPQPRTEAWVAGWRRMLGLLLTLAGIAVVISGTVTGSIHGTASDRFMFDGWLIWTLAAVFLTPWKSPLTRTVLLQWLLPGTIGLVALIPLGLIGKGNDYQEAWFVILLPVISALPFAARNISKVSDFARIYRR